MENLNGKEFVFQIQLNDYNLKYEWEFSTTRKFLNLLKKLTKQFSLIKWQKYVFFNISKLQIWFLTSIYCNIFLNLFYCQVYISDTPNECNNNLSSEQGGDSTKFQKVDVQSEVQLTPRFVIK